MSSGNIKPRILAIDYGTKRIGLAMSDPLCLFAQTIGTFNETELVQQIHTIQQQDKIEKILLGLPTNLDGSSNRMTDVTKQFAQRLKNEVDNISIEFVDEFGSSKSASSLLKTIGVSKKKRGKKGRLDKAVAAMLLEDYLQNRP